MFEDITYELLLQKILSKVPEDIDKRQGSIIYDAIAPICAELTQFYLDLQNVIKESFADTCSRKYLIKRAKERGLTPYKATKAVVVAKFTGNFKLYGGERFNLEELNFVYTGEKEEEFYILKCETAGEIGNINYGALTPIDNIYGLETANIIEVKSFGQDEEDTESLRKRYFQNFNTHSFGGNKSDYIEKVNKLNENLEVSLNGGVGGCKVYRASEGNALVKIVIINSKYSVPSEKLINIIKQKADPDELTGKGEGFAPIGHKVIVEPVKQKDLCFSANITLEKDYQFQDIKDYIQISIDKYLLKICKKWSSTEDRLVIRLSHIENIILNIKGVLDVSATKINGVEQNIILDEGFIPVRLGDFNAE